MTNKVKTYKNPKRSENTTYVKYVPNYQNLGIEPQEFRSAVVGPNAPVIKKVSEDNPRVRPAPSEPPIKISGEKVPAITFESIPNIGNNRDHTWSSVDSQIIDDLNEFPTSPDHPMIDNNDFVTEEALNIKDSEDVYEEDILPIVNDLEAGSYLLLVDNTPICSGPSHEIEDQVRALIFGEHELSGGVPISEDKIMVLKNISIKVGVFLD